MSEYCKHGIRDLATNLPYCHRCNAEAKSSLAPVSGSAHIPHEGIWRCTADDDPEKQWDSITALDALEDAEEAIASGALKIVIERISSPND